MFVELEELEADLIAQLIRDEISDIESGRVTYGTAMEIMDTLEDLHAALEKFEEAGAV